MLPRPWRRRSATDDVLYVGALEIRPATAWCSPGGRALTLSVREFELLVALARSGGRIVPREELYATRLGRRRCATATARSTSTSTSCA